MPVASPTIVTQRSPLGAPRFGFNDTYLDYAGLNWDFRVRYEQISAPSQYKRRAVRHWIEKVAAPYLLLLGLVLLQRDHAPHVGPAGFQWFLWSVGGAAAVIVAVSAALRVLTHRDFTVIPTPNGDIMVLRDKQHDAIVARLQAERRQSLRRLAPLDAANSPQEELAKLQWLRNEGAITAEECAHFAARATS